MSENEKEVIQIVGNQYIQMQMIPSINKEMIYTIKHGAVTMQINEEKAVFICERLADWLGCKVVKKEIIKILKNKANANSSKKFPLGA
jgi:hypothetical protein